MSAADRAPHWIEVGDRRFAFHVSFDRVAEIAARLAGYESDLLLVVTDDTVLELHGEELLGPLAGLRRVEVLSRPAGEAMKSLSVLSAHLDRAIAAGATRRSVVVAFGGGVPGNLAGMVAATLFRGVRLVHVPTTTVSAMDSVLSCKQAVNSGLGKNHVGCYHVPESVHADLRLLQTLPERELRAGLCEMAKNCLALRPQLLAALLDVLADGDWRSERVLRWLLEESIDVKASVLANDAHEQHEGLVLEYGHTVGHAIEFLDQRLRGAAGLSHGEAVAVGMAVAARCAAALDACDPEMVAVHDDVIAALGVPARIPDGIAIDDVIGAARRDNKRGYRRLRSDEVAMVLLRAPGEPLGPRRRPLVGVPVAVLGEALEDLARARPAARRAPSRPAAPPPRAAAGG